MIKCQELCDEIQKKLLFSKTIFQESLNPLQV